jgi:hypothetical protein
LFEKKMKLLAGLIAAASATITCPNNSWTLNTDGTACEPTGVSITCSATDMTVSFDEGHLYANLDINHLDAVTSAASVSTCTPVTSSSGGMYTITIPLDDCGTTVTQSGGLISFSNQILGDDAALTVDGIITTEKLALDVSCHYSDSFDLLVSDIDVQAEGHTLDSVGDAGDLSTEFSLLSYSESTFTDVVSVSSPVIIGQPVYNRVSVSGSLPTNVDYVVKECIAQDDVSNPTASYSILADGCLDNLVETAELSSNLRGDSISPVDFSFNGFTFESTSDTLYLECTVVLCAIDTNGDFVDPTCGFDDTDLSTTCAAASAGKALGVDPASSL